MNTLTQKQLQSALSYNPETGVFVWINKVGNIKSGDIAGSPILGYVRIKINGKAYRAHRLAWLYMMGLFPEKDIDHKNGIKSDNRFCNLREADDSQNKFNCPRNKANTTGRKGVFFVKNGNKYKYKAQAYVRGKCHHIGHYDTVEEASEMYQEFAKKVHGEFYRPEVANG